MIYAVTLHVYLYPTCVYITIRVASDINGKLKFISSEVGLTVHMWEYIEILIIVLINKTHVWSTLMFQLMCSFLGMILCYTVHVDNTLEIIPRK